MEARGPNWRWQRAWADTTWLQGLRRSLIELFSTGLVTAAALAAFSSKGAAIDALIALGASFLMVFLVRPTVGFAWNYLQAPVRALTDDVQTIRERLEATPSLPHAPTGIDIRLGILDHARKGREMIRNFGGSVPTNYAEDWTEAASTYLLDHAYALDASEIERFLETTGEFAAGTVAAKAAVLKEIADSLRARGGAIE